MQSQKKITRILADRLKAKYGSDAKAEEALGFPRATLFRWRDEGEIPGGPKLGSVVRALEDLGGNIVFPEDVRVEQAAPSPMDDIPPRAWREAAQAMAAILTTDGEAVVSYDEEGTVVIRVRRACHDDEHCEQLDRAMRHFTPPEQKKTGTS